MDHSEATQAGSTTAFVLKADYEYLADGRVAAKDDKLNDTWDRTNKYDFAGRLSFNQFGLSGSKRVYEQNVDYNAFSEMYYRATTYWGATSTLNAAYLNGRKTGPQTPAPDYDAAGNLVFERTDDHNMQTTTYDAAGRRVAFRDRWRMSASASEETETQFVFDGDGRPVVERHGSRTINTPTPPPMVVATTGYQVWSSVLGTSLTSVNTSGEKVETKVFAGGTHIATQHEMNPATTSDDSLTFVTADPVTGSVARYSGSGASADIEESEPLGQMIETSDPGTGYPTSYEDVRGIARDPEWQCMAAGIRGTFFNEMPVHCKKAKLAERDFYLPGALAESDPKRAAMPADGHGSPGRRTPPTLRDGQRLAPEYLAQMRALAATGKFDNEEDNPACGLTDCVVNVEAQSDPFASIDASVSGDDPATLLSRFLTDNPGCLVFMEDLRKRRNSRDPFGPQLSDYAKNNSGLKFIDARKSLKKTLGSFGVSSSDKTRTLKEIGGPKVSAYTDHASHQIFLFDYYYGKDPSEKRITVVHESFHDYFSLDSHVELAKAMGITGFITVDDKGGTDLARYAVNQQSASNAIDDFIRKGCKKD